MAQKRGDEAIEKLSYEEGYSRLQDILVQLESGEASLEDSLTLYARGTRLAAHCAAQLEEAELTVRRWQEQGEPIPFEKAD